MPQQVTAEVENNFTKGLITESTGLNFPENAATDTDNCTFTLIGDVLRREGIDYEVNDTPQIISRIGKAISTYKWNNVGGDGVTQIVVEQVGNTLYFYKSSEATITSPLSTKILASTVALGNFQVPGGTFDSSLECQYADGNGYLFVFQPTMDPIYCSYNAGIVTANSIAVQIRDFTGVIDGFSVTARPTAATETNAHLYNLTNQGWTQGAAWSATSPTIYTGNQISGALGSFTFSVPTGLTVTTGDPCHGVATMHQNVLPINIDYPQYWGGNVTSYVGTTLTVNITSSTAFPGNVANLAPNYFSSQTWNITQDNQAYIGTWTTQVTGFPSNADVWWYFKNSSNVFNPAVTISNVTLSTTPAPKGHYILQAFRQLRSTISSVSGITDVVTTARPRTGCWFQGRVWYTGVDGSFPASGTSNAYAWSEQIYFSQIITDPSQFGNCYQTNDPTSETLFNLLPTDGGVVQIQGCGSIYKLFPLMNALLVFAANGVWYVTGSTGIGFAADDFTIVKLSSVRSISATSFVDVQGLPIFWNEEGIYKVQPAKQGTGLLSNPLHVNPLEVVPITLGTILTFYNSIPVSSKKYARGAYHPIDYIVQWTYRDTEAPDVTGRYTYNKILNYNDSNNAFFPYTIDTSVNSINGIIYVVGPGGSNSPPPLLKYVASSGTTMSFADEHDSTFVDWASATPVNYVSHFVTGYKLRGQAIKRFQPQYIQVYSRTNGATSGYKIQGIWDFATSGNSGKYSQTQQVNILGPSNFGTIFKRHKIRGNGYVLQFFVTSTDGMPFDIQGWGVLDTVNQAA